MIGSGEPLIGEIEAILRRAGIANAIDEARQIFESVVGRTPDDIQVQAVEMATERAKGKPLAYLTGRATFMGVEMLTGAGALVPREETELLGSMAVEALNRCQSDGERRLIDMCCGAGNLACGIAARVPGLRVWASDLTDGAVALARANVAHLNLAERVTVVQGDLFAPLAGYGLEGTVDVVVCNPPYISTGKLAKERAELLEHEPREAFDGGPYGVSIFQKVVRDALAFLKREGVLMFEFGVGQERQVSAIVERTRSYDSVTLATDAAGQPRVALAKKT